MTMTTEKTAMPDEHLAVYQVIAEHSDKYITRKMILSQLGKTSDYGRRLSEIVNDLVMRYDVPLGSSSNRETKGYFIMETEADRLLARRELSSRTDSMNARDKKIAKMELKPKNDDKGDR